MNGILDIFSNCKAKITKKHKIRKARGNSGRKGTYAGRGRKGLKSRSGSSVGLTFEGGQTRTIKRIPKYGFNSKKPNNISISLYKFLKKIIVMHFTDNKILQIYKNNDVIIRKLFNIKKKYNFTVVFDNRFKKINFKFNELNDKKINKLFVFFNINKCIIKKNINIVKTTALMLSRNFIIEKCTQNVLLFCKKQNIKILLKK